MEDKNTFISILESKIIAMQKDGKYIDNFLLLFGTTKKLHIRSNEFLESMYKFLIEKGF